VQWTLTFLDGQAINDQLRTGADKTVILAQSCEWADEIDVDRAVRAKQVAEERISTYEKTNDQKNLDIAEFKLKRALNRIEIAKLK